MITFKKFLEAENKPFDSEEVSGGAEKLAEAIRKNCSDALANWNHYGGQMWRGSKQTRPSGIFRPETGTRKSANTANYYTMLLDSNPLNDKFPKRSKSFICSTRHGTALGYSGQKKKSGGAVYSVFPFNGVKVGQVNKADIWETKVIFGRGNLFVAEDTLQSWNQDFWPNMHRALGFADDWTPTMEELLDEYEKKDPKLFTDELVDMNLLKATPSPEQGRKLFDSFLDQIPNAYSYKSMGCELKDAGSYEHNWSEVWFSGPCIMINDDDWIGVSMELGL